jgi:adenylyltransferase/sulfurtransferase
MIWQELEGRRMDRYARQTRLPEVATAGQKRLGRSRVLVVGVGAIGSSAAEWIVRMGVGVVHVVDRDVVDLTNLHRQSLYAESDVGASKAEAAAARLSSINREVRVIPHAIDLDGESLRRLLNEIDLVIDGTDNAETRYVINDGCVEHGLPWIMGAALGRDGRVAMMRGHRPGVGAGLGSIDKSAGACLRCIYPSAPVAGELPTCESAGVLPGLVGMVGSMQASVAMRWLISGEFVDRLWAIDGWSLRVREIDLTDARRADCPCCGLGRYEFLDRPTSASAKLCGRGAVQVRPAAVTRIDLMTLSERLARLGVIVKSDLMLKFSPHEQPKLSMNLFADGRMILFGTEDRAEARSFYARDVGA